MNLSWQRDAKCAKASLASMRDFWPEEIRDEARKRAAESRAQAICRGQGRIPPCPVLEECLLHALRHEPWGVWGGTTSGQRQAIKTGQEGAA